VTLSLHNGPDPAQLRAYRTSATEDCQAIEPVTLQDGRASFTMPAESIVTLTTVD